MATKETPFRKSLMGREVSISNKTGKEAEMNIYVGNLSWDVTDEDLLETFKSYGEVASSSVIKDKFSGKSKGFGFVEMPDKTEAQSAINALNEKELKGRSIVVNEARPRGERSGGDRGRGGQQRRGGGRGY